ncbi:polymorphic toxin-type HINT domain-containing protein [Nonomuraea sp. NPDC005983]|uniref:polymorphic toxin-type HINT domain-containing protein n=1 Tax=Nonomuraea sp. NPDC005983 TaxID=3155595 RepID=UPI0033A7C7AC
MEETEVGDEVLATDPETGETTSQPVVGLITGEGVKNLVHISVATNDGAGVVIATDDHPFWVPALRAWIAATDLQPGVWLQTGAGTHVQVSAVERWTAGSRARSQPDRRLPLCPRSNQRAGSQNGAKAGFIKNQDRR